MTKTNKGESRNALPFALIFAIGYIAYCSIYTARLNFSVAAAALESAGSLTKTGIGVIGSIFSFTYALAKIPGGYLGDRFSCRAVIVAGLIITGAANLLMGTLPGFGAMALLWGFNAAGQAVLWGPLLRAFRDNYGKEKFSVLSRYIGSAVATGSIIGLAAASFCLTHMSVRACFTVPGVFALVMAAVVRLWFADAPGRRGEGSAFLPSAGRIVRNRQFRRVIFPAMAHGMIKDNINVWLAIYFVDLYGMDIKTMAWFVFFIPLFGMAGRLAYPALCALIKNEYKVSALCFTVCTAVNIVLLTGRISALCALLCLGLDSALVSTINAHLVATFPASISEDGGLSLAASIMDLVIYGGAGIGSVVFGRLIERSGYGAMFAVWAAVSAVSALIMLKLYKEIAAGNPAGTNGGERHARN